MKKILYTIAAVFIILLALSAAAVLLYLGNPNFAMAVDQYMADYSVSASEITPEVPTLEVSASEEPQNVPRNESGLVDDTPTYIVPSSEDLDMPDILKELTGFELPAGDTVILQDDEADRIEEMLSTGSEGDGLDFDPTYYPYYNMLDDQLKHLYRQIYANTLDGNSNFRAVEKIMSERQANNAFMAVVYDHPELIWLNPSCTMQYRMNGDFIEMDLEFNSLADNIEQSTAEFNAAVDSIISGASGSDYDKEKYVHDKLAEMNTYVFNSLDQSAYSATNTGQTICAGYSKAFSYILRQMGIPCYVCAGSAGGPHGWNIVCLDGEYYNVDVTWDDKDPSRLNYKYFNKTDSDFGYTHIRQDLSVYLPPCNGETYRGIEPEYDEIMYEFEDEDLEETLRELEQELNDLADQLEG